MCVWCLSFVDGVRWFRVVVHGYWVAGGCVLFIGGVWSVYFVYFQFLLVSRALS